MCEVGKVKKERGGRRDTGERLRVVDLILQRGQTGLVRAVNYANNPRAYAHHCFNPSVLPLPFFSLPALLL